MVDINAVYETVLTILNKEQRGYLDSTEFNNIARVVQREIFEGYFLKFAQAPNIGPAVADPKMFIDEKTSYFEGVTTISESNESSFFLWPSDFYRLGTVMTTDNIIIDNVNHKDAAYVNLSHLTAPTEKQPIYVIENGGIQVYPNQDNNAVTEVKIVYMKDPVDPEWVYDQDEFDETTDIVYSPSLSTNFQLHPSELHELVIRICAYAGVVVRAPEVTAFAQQIEGKIASTEA